MKKLKFIATIAVVACLVFGMTSCCCCLPIEEWFGGSEDVVVYGEIVVDSEMMSFYLNDNIMTWYNSYGAYASNGYISLDITKDLRDQQFGGAYDTIFLGSFNGTWYDYFLAQVKPGVMWSVVFANEAKARGIALSDADLANIERDLDDIEINLSRLGVSYSQYYGKGVDRDVARRCLELTYLAEKCCDQMWKEIESVTYMDELVDFRENNKEYFYSADCLVYSISTPSYVSGEEEYESLQAAIKEAVSKIAEAKTPEEFIEFIEKYGDYTNNDSDERNTVEADKDPYETYKQTFYYGDDEAIGSFLFGDSVAEKYDTVFIETFDKTYSYKATVYFVLEPMHYNTELTHNFAYLISSNQEDVEALIARFNASDIKDIDSFIQIAEALYLEKDSSNSNNPMFGGNSFMLSGDVFEFCGVGDSSNGAYYSGYTELDEWVQQAGMQDHTMSDIIQVKVPMYSQGLGLGFVGSSGNVSFESNIIIKDNVTGEGSYVTGIVIGGMQGGNSTAEEDTSYEKKEYTTDTSTDSEADTETCTDTEIGVQESVKDPVLFVPGDNAFVQVIIPNGSAAMQIYQTCYGVVFFEDHGAEEWYACAMNSVISEKLEAWYNERISAEEVIFTDAVNNIKTVKPDVLNTPVIQIK